jgi:membrane dipeptidase
LPKIAELLQARGYRTPEINKILGGNMLRVMREVETASREIKSKSAGNTIH